jgi:Tfp pilus assembly protein PilE
MGILTAVGVPIYQDYVISSKENTAKDNLQSIAFMQGDYRSESNQYFPCPKKTLSTTQIDKQFFGGKGKLSSGDYSYKMTGGCSGFIASALISNSHAKCFKIDQNRIISSIACPKASISIKNIWKKTYEHKALGINNPSTFNWNGTISGTSIGTNSRTLISQNGKKFFADELGITDYDLSSRSWKKCKSRYQQISNGTLKNKIKRWGYSGHKNNMYPGGKGLPYATSNLRNGRC